MTLPLNNVESSTCPTCEKEQMDTYHVRFATKKIGPTVFPDYPYMCSLVAFDYLIYSAVMKADGLKAVIEAVQFSWPDAQVHKIIRGRGTFGHEDHQLASVSLGSMACHYKRSIWQRLNPFTSSC